MLSKYQTEEFDKWLKDSLISDSNKVIFSDWIKKSPNHILLPEIPPGNGSFRMANGCLMHAYSLKINVLIGKDKWEKNLNKAFSSIKDMEVIKFHNCYANCPFRCGIDERKTRYFQPGLAYQKGEYKDKVYCLLYLCVGIKNLNTLVNSKT